jgi:hypothetical protein
MNYLGSEVAQEYRATDLGPFFQRGAKEANGHPSDDDNHLSISANGINDQLFELPRRNDIKALRVILTKAVGEISEGWPKRRDFEPPCLVIVPDP